MAKSLPKKVKVGFRVAMASQPFGKKILVRSLQLFRSGALSGRKLLSSFSNEKVENFSKRRNSSVFFCDASYFWPTWVAKMMKLERDDRTASWLDVDQPAAGCSPSRHCIAGHYQGDATSPHWVKKPHQELTPAIMTMFVAGSSWEYWEKLPCCETLHSPPYGNFSDFHTVLSSGRVKTCQI